MNCPCGGVGPVCTDEHVEPRREPRAADAEIPGLGPEEPIELVDPAADYAALEFRVVIHDEATASLLNLRRKLEQILAYFGIPGI